MRAENRRLPATGITAFSLRRKHGRSEARNTRSRAASGRPRHCLEWRLMVRNRGPRRRASSYVRERAAAEGSTVARLKQALAARGLSPRKRFGQNFLVREDLAERIVEHCHLREDDVVVEIGPGAGALTPLIARQVRHLVAVEKDFGLVELLREELAETPRVEFVEGDFLEFDLAAAAAAHGVSRLAVVRNIPYNITTPVIEH